MGAELTRQRTLDREMTCWRLRCQGLTQWQIAERVGISQAAVSKILDRVTRRLNREFASEAWQHRFHQTQVLEHVLSEAMTAWERSKQPAEIEVTVQVRATADADGSAEVRARTTRTVTQQTGNPAYLQAALKAMEGIRALWGLNTPERQEQSGPFCPVPTIREVIVELPRERVAPGELSTSEMQSLNGRAASSASGMLPENPLEPGWGAEE